MGNYQYFAGSMSDRAWGAQGRMPGKVSGDEPHGFTVVCGNVAGSGSGQGPPPLLPAAEAEEGDGKFARCHRVGYIIADIDQPARRQAGGLKRPAQDGGFGPAALGGLGEG